MAIDPDMDRLIADLSALVAIRSESPWQGDVRAGFREREIADWLLACMSELGLEVGEAEVSPGRPNIWGRRKGLGGGPTLMLNAHMDTVGVDGYLGDPFLARVEGGKLFGRGSCDMKGAIACFLETVRLLKSVELKGDLLLLFVADEEHGMTGSAHAGKHGPSADFAIVGEPTKLAVCPKHKGELCGSVTVHGRAAHTSVPEHGRNAILDMSAVIQALEAYGEELMTRTPHPICGTGRCTVSTIQGGTTVSSVPDRCGIQIDRRCLPDENVENVMAELEAVLEGVRRERPGLQVELGKDALFLGPLDTDENAPITRAALKATSAILGEKPAISSFTGGTDGPNLQISTVILGPGDLAQAHTVDEWIELDQLEKACAIYRELAIDLLS